MRSLILFAELHRFAGVRTGFFMEEDKLKFQLRYLVMPDYIYSDTRLSDVSRRVYCFIHSYKNPFYFGNENMAEMFGCHPETISTAIKQLESFGLIRTEYKVKAGGGKIRLSVDTGSEPVSTLVREENFEPTNQSGHLDKDIKDNNLMSEKKTEKKYWKKTKRGDKPKVLGNSTAFMNPFPYKKEESQEKKKSRAIDISNI